MNTSSRTKLLVLALLGPSLAASAAPREVEKNADGVTLAVPGGSLRVQLISDRIARIAFAKDKIEDALRRDSLAVLPQAGLTKGWKTSSDAKQTVLRTAKLKIVVEQATGAVSFFDAKGQRILAEVPGGRTLTPTVVQGEVTAHVQQKWVADPRESLYGLAQRQLGMLDIKGYDLDLWQRNTHVVSPLLVSSKGYGIFWDNLSYTRFGDLRPFEPIPASQLFDAQDQPGGFTQTALDGPEASKQSATINLHLPEGQTLKRYRWEGKILAPQDGDYQFKTYSNGGIKVWIDGQLRIDHWRQTWLADEDLVKVRLEAGKRYAIKVETDNEQQNTVVLTWKTPNPDPSTALWSEVADGLDYYFVYGPRLDDVVAGVRTLTGQATMLPNWCFGLWQSRQRYETQQESLDVVKEFRRRQIPFDNIVQDWQYWRLEEWGSHRFDARRFPDPEGWIKAIHAANAHLMISVWGKFNPNTDLAKEMIAKGFLYPTNLKEHTLDWMNLPHSEYDAFNPEARALFWKRLDERLFRKGIDAWWMDATEPDMFPSPPTLPLQKKHMNPTFLGTASRVLNGYALQNSLGVYTGQRQAAPNQRVFILTRSGYTGQQRYATATWSGDITSTWSAMAKQIPAGLGFTLTGVPYWATDTAGYTMQAKWDGKHPKPADEEEWRELNTRWFQWSAFTPLLRVHGENRPREMWTMGGDQHPAYLAHVKADRLRYALYPYIYSVAGAVTRRDDTMMRPLVMDFPKDEKARTLTDEYQFGPAFLVAPVTTYQARQRAVYLPAGADWFEFWSGKAVAGGTTLDAAAPLDEMPLFVKAGAILPVGPAIQYIGERPSDPLTLYVYQGANGAFTLYEDQGTTYDYEKGAFSEIPLRWNQARKTLTIGARQGRFPGMLDQRTFHLVVVSKSQATGFGFSPTPAKTVTYTGKPLTIRLP